MPSLIVCVVSWSCRTVRCLKTKTSYSLYLTSHKEKEITFFKQRQRNPIHCALVAIFLVQKIFVFSNFPLWFQPFIVKTTGTYRCFCPDATSVGAAWWFSSSALRPGSSNPPTSRWSHCFCKTETLLKVCSYTKKWKRTQKQGSHWFKKLSRTIITAARTTRKSLSWLLYLWVHLQTKADKSEFFNSTFNFQRSH